MELERFALLKINNRFHLMVDLFLVDNFAIKLNLKQILCF